MADDVTGPGRRTNQRRSPALRRQDARPAAGESKEKADGAETPPAAAAAASRLQVGAGKNQVDRPPRAAVSAESCRRAGVHFNDSLRIFWATHTRPPILGTAPSR